MVLLQGWRYSTYYVVARQLRENNQVALEKMSKHVLLTNGTIKDPFHNKTYEADIWIKDGNIFDIGDVKAPNSSDIINCSGIIITHGF